MSPDVIIVGGGVIGCSAAYFLAREGLSVTLLERDGLAAHASGAAAGMLAPICESTGEGPLFELGVRSLAAFGELAPRLRELSGIDPQLVPSGILRVALSAEEAGHLRDQVTRAPGHGLEWLEPPAARELVPEITPESFGALWSRREGHVYSPAVTRAYAGAAARLGAQIETGVPVLEWIQRDGRVMGVRTADGVKPSGHVVVCAGAWTPFLRKQGIDPVPVSPVRGQILALTAPQPGFGPIVWGEGAYLVPKLNGSVVVGATEEHAGYDCRTTVAGIAGLLAAAPRLVPALAESAFLTAWAGLRPDTPDHLPLVGPVPGVEGLILAAGHFRNGVLLSPVTGELVAGTLLGRPRPAAAEALLPSRFLRA
jgi:glycine oxidase